MMVTYMMTSVSTGTHVLLQMWVVSAPCGDQRSGGGVTSCREEKAAPRALRHPVLDAVATAAILLVSVESRESCWGGQDGECGCPDPSVSD